MTLKRFVASLGIAALFISSFLTPPEIGGTLLVLAIALVFVVVLFVLCKMI